MEDCILHVNLIMVVDKKKSRIYPSKDILKAIFYVKIDRYKNKFSIAIYQHKYQRIRNSNYYYHNYHLLYSKSSIDW